MKLKLFGASFLITLCTLLAYLYFERPKNTAPVEPELDQVANGLYVTGQLKPEDLAFLNRRGVKTVVDCRPDGEVRDQPRARSIELAAKGYDMDFYYIPVPHGDVPDSAVDTLGTVLAQQKTLTVLYCRTGNRAMRTLALVEASRPGGPSADAIVEMVRRAGFSADDLKGNIDRRIADRDRPQEEKK